MLVLLQAKSNRLQFIIFSIRNNRMKNSTYTIREEDAVDTKAMISLLYVKFLQKVAHEDFK